MSNTNRNFIIAYALLVALPMVGLAAVLKGGRRLSAPVAVDGVWSVQTDPAQLASQTCGTILTAPSAFVISQSGRSFVLSSASEPRFTALGTIDGSTLNALIKQPPLPQQEGCDGREWLLQATVELKTTPRTLVGTLTSNSRVTAFRAMLKTPNTSGGGR